MLRLYWVVAEVDPNRPDRRFVAESDARRDGATAAHDLSNVREILQAAATYDRAVEKCRPLHFLCEGHTPFDAPFEQGDAPNRARREFAVAQPGRVRIAAANVRGTRVTTRVEEILRWNRENPRPKLVFIVSAYRVRAARIKSGPGMEQLDSGVCAGQRAHEAHASVSRQHLRARIATRISEMRVHRAIGEH